MTRVADQRPIEAPTLWSNFYLFIGARFLSNLSLQIQSVAVGWQIYDLTRDPVALGYVGLAQFLPLVAFLLPAGDFADRFDRRKILSLAFVVEALSSLLLLGLSASGTREVGYFYAALALFGTARAFAGPAGVSIVPLLVARADLPRAVALNSSTFQTAMIAGPAVGGLLYIFGAVPTYAVCAGLFLTVGAVVSVIALRQAPKPDDGHQNAVARLTAGIAYMRRNPIVLGATSLDLFAVLLSGATALMPVYARDILDVGPAGLGMLRSAPAIGALCTALLLVRWPLGRHAGVTMFGFVALFGLATIVFGLSENVILSLAALVVLGASDMVSVYVRANLIQLATPDEMRGRVSAVDLLFIGASNELGEFRAGFMAGFLGTVTTVVAGGLGAILVVGLWMRLFPELRTVDRLADVKPL